MRQIVVTTIVLVAANLGSSGAPVDAYWPTPEERLCAESIGVNFKTAFHPAESTVMRGLAWTASLVIVGEVTRVFHGYERPYLTTVEVAVDSVLMGHSDHQRVCIDLRSGPTADDGGYVQVSTDPNFRVGESVLLFLNRRYAEISNEPAYWLADGHYVVPSSGKFLVDDDQVVSEWCPEIMHSLAWVSGEVDLASMTRRRCAAE